MFGTQDIAIDLSRYTFANGLGAEGPVVLASGDAAAGQPFNRNVEVEVVEPMGSDTLVWSKLGGQEFRFRVDGQSMLRAGDRVQIGFDPAQASVFDAESEHRR